MARKEKENEGSNRGESGKSDEFSKSGARCVSSVTYGGTNGPAGELTSLKYAAPEIVETGAGAIHYGLQCHG